MTVDEVFERMEKSSNDGIHLDSEDVNTILSKNGLQKVIVIENLPVDTIETLKKGLESYINNDEFKNAKGYIFHFEIKTNYSLLLVSEIMEHFHDYLSDESDIIFSTANVDNLEEGHMNIMIIVSGI